MRPIRVVSAKLRDAAPGEDLASVELDDTGWLEVPIPGDVHRTLVTAGRIDDPDVDLNDDACAWMEDREWWYRMRLPSVDALDPDERVLLVCHGLDTFATVWLNGVALGEHHNMFRPAVFDVGRVLRGDDLLAICFSRPAASVDEEPPATIRKAQFSYGWDFAPRLPAIGAWQPIELVRQCTAAIKTVRFQTMDIDSAGDAATVRVGVDVDHFGAATATLTAHLRLSFPDGTHGGGRDVADTTVPVVDGRAVVELLIPSPLLWWPNDVGDQHLYDLDVALLADRLIVDADRRSVGIRTVQLEQAPDPDEPGAMSFRFVVNGRPVPMKGANWVPCDTALGATDTDRYARLLTAARDAHMNMLRVWGGGIYEQDVFYETCDRLGLLVWQDFMFACFDYRDDDPAFVDEVDAEARHQVRRLASHPCLALWCGNNEVELLASIQGWANKVPARRLFYDVLPRAVADEDGSTPYIPTSPVHGNDMRRGDRHAWEVWHGISEDDVDADSSVAWATDGQWVDPTSETARAFTRRAGAARYLEDTGRFASEYGLASTAALETFARWTDPGELRMGGPNITHRVRSGRLGPANKFELLLGASTGTPEDLRDVVELSQLAQAEGVKLGAEHYRRRWPHSGGSLIWQLDDCWPAISWSMIDFDLRPKPVWYYARRFFAPVLASFRPTGDDVELWVSNDTAAAVTDSLCVRLESFDGATAWEETVAVAVPGGTSRRVASWSSSSFGPPAASYLTVRSDAGTMAPNRHFLAPIRDLARRVSPVTYDAQQAGSRVSVTVTSDSYALVVHVITADPSVWFTDNCFDLEPGESRTVTAVVPTAFDLAAVVVRSR